MKQKKPKQFLGLTGKEIRILKKLDSPSKVQDFLDALQVNFEKEEETLSSPQGVLKKNNAHCMEAALLAAVAFWYHGRPPLLLDLQADLKDLDHVVALFKVNGLWGAVSKSNHAVLRYREPIFKNIRELALSYFHEYFLDNGKKTLRAYSRPFDLRRYKDPSWIVSKENLWHIAEDLDQSVHYKILNKEGIRNLRPATAVEIKAGKLVVRRA